MDDILKLSGFWKI